MNKKIQLYNLAKIRKETIFEDCYPINYFDNGIWECDFVSPISKSSCNENSDILIMMQDWRSSESFKKDICIDTMSLGYDPTIKTNINLMFLLEKYFNKNLSDVYTTNLFPLIKEGSMNSKLSRRALLKSAKIFAIPQVKIIEPKVVICLGLATYNAMYQAISGKTKKTIDDAINSPFMIGGSMVFCQAHTGMLGKNNRNKGGVDRVNGDWLGMSEFYNSLKN